MPHEIQEFIDYKFQGTPSSEDKAKNQILAHNFFQRMVQNSVPIVKNYIEDMVQVASSSTQQQKPVPLFNNQLDNLGVRLEELAKEDVKSPEIEHLNPYNKVQCSEEENKFYLLDEKKPAEYKSTEIVPHDLAHQFSEVCSLSGIPKLDYDFELAEITELIDNPTLREIANCVSQDNCLKYILQELIEEGRKQRDSDEMNVLNYRRSWETIEFYPPVTGPSAASSRHLHNYGLQNLKSDDLSLQKKSIACSRKSSEHQSSRQSPRGFSLNERVLGRRLLPVYDENKSDRPSFEILKEELPDQLVHSDYLSPSSKLKEVDPLLHMALRQCGKELLESDSVVMIPQKLTNEFRPSSSVSTKPQQVIFSNAFEHEFYTSLINNSQDISARIFEIRRVWVEQRVLALSMSPGGWIHPHVMDCFGMLLNTDQNQRMK